MTFASKPKKTPALPWLEIWPIALVHSVLYQKMKAERSLSSISMYMWLTAQLAIF